MHARAFPAAVATAMHAALALAVLLVAPSRVPQAPASAILVRLIPAAPPAEDPRPVSEPPRPKAVGHRMPERMAAPPTPLAVPDAAAAAVAAPAPSPAPSTVLPVASAAPPAAPSVTPPVFDAHYLENPPPPYPRLARRSGLQGRVVLRVLVNAAGTADDVQVRTSSGHDLLDDAARDTVRRWKFTPAQRAGEPVAAWVLIPISFRLEG